MSITYLITGRLLLIVSITFAKYFISTRQMSTALLQKNIDHLASLRSKLLRVEKRKRFVAEQSRVLLLQAKVLALFFDMF